MLGPAVASCDEGLDKPRSLAAWRGTDGKGAKTIGKPLSLLLAAALLAAPAAASAADPSTPGVWGAIFDGFWEPQGEAQARDRALACLANPVRLETLEEGYRVTTFVLDPAALETGALAYFRDYETSCRWEPEARIEQCYDEAGELYFHTAYRDVEGAPGVLRAWFLDGRDLEGYFNGGLLPAQDQSYLIFPCGPEDSPPAAALAAATADPAAASAALERYDGNWRLCGSPLCGLLDERLLELAR